MFLALSLLLTGKDESSSPIIVREKPLLFGIEHSAIVHAIKEEEDDESFTRSASSPSTNRKNNHIPQTTKALTPKGKINTVEIIIAENYQDNRSLCDSPPTHIDGNPNKEEVERYQKPFIFSKTFPDCEEGSDRYELYDGKDASARPGLKSSVKQKGQEEVVQLPGVVVTQSPSSESTLRSSRRPFEKADFQKEEQEEQVCEAENDLPPTGLEQKNSTDGRRIAIEKRDVSLRVATLKGAFAAGSQVPSTDRNDAMEREQCNSRESLISSSETDDGNPWVKRSDSSEADAFPTASERVQTMVRSDPALDVSHSKNGLFTSESSAAHFGISDIKGDVTVSPKFLTQRRVSLTQSRPSNGVQARTHIKLQRAKSTDNVLGESQRRKGRGQGMPLNFADMMKAFHDAPESAKLADIEESTVISSSTPDIRSKKSVRYFKKLRALVTSRTSKSLAELEKASANDMKDTDSKASSKTDDTETTPVNVEISSASSVESLSDADAAANAKELLHTLGQLQQAESSNAHENKIYKAKENDDVGTNVSNQVENKENDISNGIHLKCQQKPTVEPLPNQDSNDGLLHVQSNGVSQSLFGSGNIHRRLRTLSETNYSLLRPYMDDKHKSSSTVVFNRIPSIRHRHFHIRFRHHLQVISDTDDLDDVCTLKDATHVNPLDTGDVIVTDILSHRLVVFDRAGLLTVTFAMEPGSEPYATCMTPDGDLAVSLKRQGCVSLWSSTGEPISEFGQEYLSSPSGIQCDSVGRLIVADEETDHVLVFDFEGNLLFDLNEKFNGGKASTNATDPANAASKQQSSTAYPFSKPRFICLTPDRNYVISDSANHCIKVFDSSLNFIGQFGEYGRGDGQFRFPYGVACDKVGNLFIADHFNNRISIFDKNWKFLEHVSPSDDQITRPKCLAVRDGLMYVTYGDLRANKVAVFQIQRA
ncbi:tripartite motif-containing protein 2 [Plakobranchus ocellatus]|uniref:Tripartite motif-containing protein 2 n=1 Tax=Plakobranchus ocellatus TaxID=259542 RepID=A0AAV3YUI1_9GAST|nr:tripartite motif-containing protein 2 [Plakobranchus ocellatus]